MDSDLQDPRLLDAPEDHLAVARVFLGTLRSLDLYSPVLPADWAVILAEKLERRPGGLLTYVFRAMLQGLSLRIIAIQRSPHEPWTYWEELSSRQGTSEELKKFLDVVEVVLRQHPNLTQEEQQRALPFIDVARRLPLAQGYFIVMGAIEDLILWLYFIGADGGLARDDEGQALETLPLRDA